MTTPDFTIDCRGDKGRALDRLGIADAAYLYGAAVDTLGNHPHSGEGPDAALAEAEALLVQALTPDARLSLLLAGSDGPDTPLGEGGPAGVARAVRTYFSAYGYVGTFHPVANVRVAFTGEESATATSRIPCYHWLADGRMLLTPVEYLDELVRQRGIWRIAERRISALRFWVTQGHAPDPLDPRLS